MRVNGVGPRPCSICFVGSTPGYYEDKTGIPFTGPTGQEVNRYLDGTNLPLREDIFLTNLYREYGGKDYTYTKADFERDEPSLLTELEEVCPELIVTLGAEATRYFLGDVELDSVHALPWQVGTRVIIPLFHPAAGLYSPDIQGYVSYGFGEVARYLRGETHARALYDDPHEGTETYRECLVPGDVDIDPTLPLCIDTEGWPGRVWSIQYSQRPGVGSLIRAGSRDVLARFGHLLRTLRPRLVFHSALHDLAIMRELGLPLDLDFDDTMIMSYLLQVEPRGLKPLCVRHCGMQMQSFDEIMDGASHRLAVDYLVSLHDIEAADWEERNFEAFCVELDKGRRLTKVPQTTKTPLHKAVLRCLRSPRARGLWEDQLEDIQVAGYSRLGPIPLATLDHVPQATAIHYGCRDADGTGRLRPELLERVEAFGLKSVYDLEVGTYPLIERMHYIGIRPDLEVFAALSRKLEGELDTLRSVLRTATAQEDFNANSGDQVAAYLFDTLGLEEGKRTRSGRGSTNDKILEGLEHAYPEYEVISSIRAYRELFKLKNTFVDRLPDFTRKYPYDGRIHATFRTTTVVTGRLSASEPNLLAQPEHGKFAKDFKRGWVADEGHVFGAWDESQVELRGLAHLSKDPVLLRAFSSGQDLHAKLAVRIFGGKEDDYRHTCYERFAVKEINFGIPNGMGPKGLMVALRSKGVKADEQTAAIWLRETLGLYKGVKRYMETRKAEARRYGYVTCLSGRRRYVGGIRSQDDGIREAAERLAFSTPIQESAQYIMKQAEASVWQDIICPLQRDGHWIEPLLQVHDSLKLEMEEGLAQSVHTQMVQAMTRVPKSFCVPLAVEGEFGPNMADMERFT